MLVRTVSALAVLALSGLVTAAPVLAQPSVTPAQVLAAKVSAKGARGFADRTARLSSIMGPEASVAAPLHLPTAPAWKRPVRREADATGGIR